MLLVLFFNCDNNTITANFNRFHPNTCFFVASSKTIVEVCHLREKVDTTQDCDYHKYNYVSHTTSSLIGNQMYQTYKSNT